MAIVKLHSDDTFIIAMEADDAACLVADLCAIMDTEEMVPHGTMWMLVHQLNKLWYAKHGMNICADILAYSDFEDLYEAMEEEE